MLKTGFPVFDLLTSHGDGSGKPGPDTVGTDEIIDGSVEMVDLSKKVKDKMLTDSDRVSQEDIDNFEV